MDSPARGNGGAVWGLALIVIGAVLLLDRFERIDIGDFWRLWPLIVIYFGAVQLLRPSDGKRSAWLFLVGLWLLVSTMEWYGFDFGNSWPLLIMLAGVAMLFDHRFGRRRTPETRRNDEWSNT